MSNKKQELHQAKLKDQKIEAEKAAEQKEIADKKAAASKKAAFVVNKNIIHNGKAYEKGQPISKEDGNFEIFQKAGHVDAQGAAEQKPVEPEQPESESEQ